MWDRWIATVSIVFASACGPLGVGAQLDVQADDSFTADERAIIEDSLATWRHEAPVIRYSVRYVARQDVIDGYGADGVWLLRDYDRTCPFSHGETEDFVALTCRVPGSAGICVFGLPDRRVLLHEFGHAMGLQHVVDAPSVMRPVLGDAAWAPTAIDIARVGS